MVDRTKANRRIKDVMIRDVVTVDSGATLLESPSRCVTPTSGCSR